MKFDFCLGAAGSGSHLQHDGVLVRGLVREEVEVVLTAIEAHELFEEFLPQALGKGAGALDHRTRGARGGPELRRGHSL